jgi:hypothetical protein
MSAILFELIPHGKLNQVPISDAAFNTRGDYASITLGPCWNDRVDLDAYSVKWVVISFLNSPNWKKGMSTREGQSCRSRKVLWRVCGERENLTNR